MCYFSMDFSFILKVSFFCELFKSWCKNIEILCFSRKCIEPLFYNTEIIWKNEHVFYLNVELYTFDVDFKGELWTDEY